jgi:FAD/FMN-containing dehydrogenase
MSSANTMSSVLPALIEALGLDAVRAGAQIEARYLGDWSGRSECNPLAVVLPRTVDEVSTLLQLCHEARQSVVPQGGRTGLAGGAIPSSGSVCVSLERMNHIEEIDRASATMTVQAGATLQSVQQAADEAGFDFALDLGARGSCQIGGTLATNAGGHRVPQSGCARDQVLGLEVVLADGSILNSMHKVLKNNTGYDLRHLFIGSEGTLGIITRAVLRLRPRRAARNTALCALEDFAAAVALLRSLQTRLGDEISAFEVMWPEFFDFGVAATRSQRAPFEAAHPLYALIERAGFADDGGEQFTAVLNEALEAGRLRDVVVATSSSHALSLWSIREATAEFAGRIEPINFDVSLPIADIGRFVEVCRDAFEGEWPGCRGLYFGHIGDSNLHVTFDARSIPPGSGEAVDRLLYGLVRDFHGSISAEHGIGSLKREYLGYSRSPNEIACMRAIKQALDPRGILNPGKLL